MIASFNPLKTQLTILGQARIFAVSFGLVLSGQGFSSQKPKPVLKPVLKPALKPVLKLGFTPKANLSARNFSQEQNARKARWQEIRIQLNGIPECTAYLHHTLGKKPRRLPWRNLEPFGEISLSASSSLRGGHYLIEHNARGKRRVQPWPEGDMIGLYLARHSGAAFGSKLILTKGRIVNLDRTHLFCGWGKNLAGRLSLWRHSTGTLAVRLIGSQQDLVRYPFLPALSRGKAESLTRSSARKAAESLAATFNLAAPTALDLVTYRRQGELIQVNYTVRFSDGGRDLVLIGDYTNGVFAPRHLHFSQQPSKPKTQKPQ